MNGNIVLVGAGGTGMSGIAGILSDLGFKNLICIDGTQSQLTDNLKNKLIQVFIGHGKYKIQARDIVIYSEATVNSIEVQTAKARPNDIKWANFCMNYFQFLGEISKYFVTAGIAGTNGKSTTTAMSIFLAKKHLPNFGIGILGALVPDLDGQNYYINKNIKPELRHIFDSIFTTKTNLNYEIVKKYIFIVEACEYKRHFLHLDLDYSIIINIKLDHTDYYRDEADYFDAFESLIQKTKRKVLILDGRMEKWRNGEMNVDLLSKIKEVQVENIDFEYVFGEKNVVDGNFAIKIIESLSDLTLNLSPNRRLKRGLGIILKSEIEKFKGLWRRMELVGKSDKGALIYSDYGHIAESIGLGFDALKKKYPDKKLFVIFQPHQISRIMLGRDEFKKVLPKYDQVVIYDIYAARESVDLVKKIGIEGIETVKDLGEELALQCGGTYIDTFESLIQKIQDSDQDFVVVYFSAGDLDFKMRTTFSLQNL